MPFDYKLIAWKIKKRRKQLNLSIYKASVLSSISKNTIIKYETGEIPVSTDDIKTFSDIYGLKLNCLFELPNDFPNQKTN